ncbi:MAG: D-aminoacyl-tRNA deacylase [Actinomycetota bacterium]
MRAVVQRVSRAAVTVDGEVVGSIEHGLCVLVGVTHDDSEAQAIKLAERLWKLRIFTDSEGKMNHSVADVAGSVLIISQFTLYGDARKGNRPSYVDAARPEVAEPLVQRVVDRLTELGAPVATGRFGADMSVDLVNDGPVTISLELSASS